MMVVLASVACTRLAKECVMAGALAVAAVAAAAARMASVAMAN